MVNVRLVAFLAAMAGGACSTQTTLEYRRGGDAASLMRVEGELERDGGDVIVHQDERPPVRIPVEDVEDATLPGSAAIILGGLIGASGVGISLGAAAVMAEAPGMRSTGGETCCGRDFGNAVGGLMWATGLTLTLAGLGMIAWGVNERAEASEVLKIEPEVAIGPGGAGAVVRF